MDLSKYFPYKEVRPQQEEVIQTLLENWDKKKYFILQLDVGTGKSGIAKCMANYSPSSFIITSTKQLQDQYLSDFANESNMAEIKGKNNYKCLRNTNTTCDLATCKIGGRSCPLASQCLYTVQRKRAQAAQICLTSYAYALKAITNESLWPKRDLIVFDEAHLLESELVNLTSFYLDPQELEDKYDLYNSLSDEEYRKVMSKTSTDFWPIINATKRTLEEKIKDFDLMLEDIDESEIDQYKKTMKDKEKLATLSSKICCFSSTYSNDLDWLTGRTAEGGWQFTPLKVKNLFKYFCSEWANKFIFMSATILDIDGYIEQLGVNKEDCCVIKMESEFDPKKSPIYFMPCGSMSFKDMNETLPKEGKIVKQIMTAHEDEKGIIHSGNYKVAQYFYQHCYSSRYLYNKDGETNNQTLIGKHTKSYKPTVLLSPSMTTGVDLRDDLSRWQVVAKLPYKSLADERVKKLSEIDPNWYACDTLRSLIQACGRSTRSADDSSKTYVLDGGFARLVKMHKSWLPQSFLKRIVGLDV